jgi:magnesium-transporting ATPase (P-type)
MAVLTEGAAGRADHVKGAPERVLRMCAGLERAALAPAGEDVMARRGLRVLALGRAGRARANASMAAALDGGLTFLGLVGLIDPPRPEAIAAVAECRAAGNPGEDDHRRPRRHRRRHRRADRAGERAAAS